MRAIIYEGARYCTRSEESQFPGFGGRKFTIQFSDGVIVQTKNLWLDYSYSPHVDTPDTAKIFTGWDDPKPENQCHWKNAGQYKEFSV